jgi:hypothetical protein
MSTRDPACVLPDAMSDAGSHAPWKAGRGVTRRIPNQFHFVYGLKRQTEAFPLIYYVCLESCRQVNRPERILLHCHHLPHGRYWDLIRGKVELVHVSPDEFVARYRYGNRAIKRFAYAHHSDFIRLQKLLEYGGIYADIDTIFVNPIPNALYEKPFVLGREDDIVCQKTGRRFRSLCNAFIMSAKDSEFGRRWLAEMPDAFDGSWSSHSTILPQRLSEQYPGLVHVEPQRTFYKHMWTPAGIDTLLRRCDRDVEGVVSMHLWSHLWWSRWRRDFSDFHGGLLTEDFIRNVDTTYNVLARRFLPEQGEMPPKRRWWSHLLGGGTGRPTAGGRGQ